MDNALELRLYCTNTEGLLQERRKSNALAIELRLSCTKLDGLVQKKT